jgi:hypothetical protein
MQRLIGAKTGGLVALEFNAPLSRLSSIFITLPVDFAAVLGAYPRIPVNSSSAALRVSIWPWASANKPHK